MTTIIPSVYDRPMLQPWSPKIIVAPNGCWVWTGHADKKTGYAKSRLDNIKDYVHRISWMLVHGPLPRDRRMVIDHLCRVKRCCNPAHLELVTASVNILRGNLPAITTARNRATAAAMVTCRKGHPYSGANLRFTPDGKRYCWTCRKAVWDRHNKKRRT